MPRTAEAGAIEGCIILLQYFPEVDMAHDAVRNRVAVIDLHIAFAAKESIVVIVYLVRERDDELRMRNNMCHHDYFPVADGSQVVFQFLLHGSCNRTVVVLPMHIPAIIPTADFQLFLENSSIV